MRAVGAAWWAAQEAPTWGPARNTWSRQRVVGREGTKLRIELQAPTGIGEWEEGERDDAWGEEELESFLQQCELEAGWRDCLEEGEGQRLARTWRELEAEMTMAGIRGPLIGEGGGDARVESEQAAAEVFDAPVVPAHKDGDRNARGAEERRKQKRRKWRPIDVDQVGEGPRLDLEEGVAEVRQARDEQEAESMQPPEEARPQRTRKVRPRGRRQRGGPPETFDIDFVTFNGSGAPQALEAMRALEARRKSLGALLLQEHHARGDPVADLQTGARTRGFRLLANEATDGKGGGASAGVGIAVPTQRGCGGIFGPSYDFSPAESPGRLAGTWVQAGPRGGMIALSIYCWPTEGMTLRNVKLVEKALEVVTASGCTWIIAGDFNATPSELRAAVGGLLDRAGGVVRAPLQPTCYPAAGSARILDYFIVDARVAAASSLAEVDEAVVGSPHRAVRIRVRGRDVGGLVQMVKKPRMFPRERPIGCARRPLVPRWEEGGKGEREELTLEEEWRRLAYCVEGELCRQCDLVDSDGVPDRRFLGRGEGMKLVLRPLTAPRAMARHGRADAQLHRLAWTLNRLE